MFRTVQVNVWAAAVSPRYEGVFARGLSPHPGAPWVSLVLLSLFFVYRFWTFLPLCKLDLIYIVEWK